jgi:hypothetical protein
MRMKTYSNRDKLIVAPAGPGLFIKGSPRYIRHTDCTCPALVLTVGRLVNYLGVFPCPVHGDNRSQSILDVIQ